MKKLVTCAVLAGLLVTAGAAVAGFGYVDAVPAATLLLPRFEVDLNGGITTLFSINNASAAPQLAHVTVWSEWSVPILDFDVYLTGYDVQTINLADVIINGVLPQTGSNVLVSPQGPLSLPNVAFPGCSTGTTPGNPPVYAQIGPTFLSVIQAALSGAVIPAGASVGLCAAGEETDIARGYITVDNVDLCNQQFPNSSGYFGDGGVNAIANNNNTLWGDYFIIDPANAFAQGLTLVHVEAENTPSAAVCDTTDFNPTTFYCRYTIPANPSPGADDREALGSVSASRYINGGVFTGGTDLLVYRDPNLNQSATSCALGPSWVPLLQREVIVFDEQEDIILITEGPSGFDPAEENPFPLETNRTTVGVDLGTGDFEFGWIYLNLNDAVTAGVFNQAYVTTVMSALGQFSVGFDSIQLNSLTNGATDFLPDDGTTLLNP